jgi:hypothetical protein
VTLYEAENASGLANGQPFPSFGSSDKPSQSVDGSDRNKRYYLNQLSRFTALMPFIA